MRRRDEKINEKGVGRNRRIKMLKTT